MDSERCRSFGAVCVQRGDAQRSPASTGADVFWTARVAAVVEIATRGTSLLLQIRARRTTAGVYAITSRIGLRIRWTNYCGVGRLARTRARLHPRLCGPDAPALHSLGYGR